MIKNARALRLGAKLANIKFADNKPINVKLPLFAHAALRVLNEAGEEAYVVGGFIRDALLGIVDTDTDIDIATSATPERTEEIFQAAGYQTIPTGKKHGTITALINNHALEITTFRTEGAYTDNRHPDHVNFNATLEQDLSRRDFTINAIAFHPNIQGSGLIDPFGGLQDLQNKTIRAIGDPEKRFLEDALRVFRAVRFACMLGFSIEKNTWQAACRQKNLLDNVAVERIGKEMQKIVRAPFLSYALTHYQEVLFQVLPEIATLDGYEQDTPYHCFDALKHSARVIDFVQVFSGVDTEAQVNKIPAALGWAALLHDIGKPDVMLRDPQTNCMHFYGHPQRGVEIAHPILKRFGVNKKTREKVLALIRLHDRPVGTSSKAFLQLLTALSQLHPNRPAQLLYPLSILRQADAAAKAPEYRDYATDIEKLLSEQKRLSREEKIPLLPGDLALGGAEIIQQLSAEPGPWVGEVLQELLSMVQDGSVENARASLKGALPKALFARNRKKLADILVPGSLVKRSFEGYTPKKQIGLELERFVVSSGSGERLYYETGIKQILSRWLKEEEEQGEEKAGAQLPRAIFDDGMLIGCLGSFLGVQYSLTLEPGSQLEVSLGPATSVSKLQKALDAFDEKFQRIAGELGLNVALIARGVDPTNTPVDRVPLLKKPRYCFMDRYLSSSGTAAKDMMRRTASTQISIDNLSNRGSQDNRDEISFEKEYQLATALSSLLYFLCNNIGSREYFMERSCIWENVDSKRCGVVPGTFEKRFSAETYLDWVLACPAIFVPLDNGDYWETGAETIGSLLSKRIYSKRELQHFASILFPDVRLKGFLELRTADSMEPKYALSLAAFIEGIFYHEKAFEKSYELLVKPQIGHGIAHESARKIDGEIDCEPFMPMNWDDDFYGRPFSEIIKELMEISATGLANNSDKEFLPPLFDLWREKKLLSDL